MKRNLIIIAVIIFLGLGVYAFVPTSNTPINPSPISTATAQDLSRAPNFTFTSIDGKERSLNEFSGKIILLHFWASWCPPCVVELPSLIKLAKDHPDDLVVLAFSNDNDSEIAARFLSKRSINLHSSNIIWSWDKDKKITYDTFQTMILPETILLTRDLKMVKKYVGNTDWSAPAIRAELNEFLNTK